MKKVLVTGAGGFVGSNLCAHLESKNYTVVKSYHTPDSDLTDPTYVANLPDVDIVVHLAGINDPKKFASIPHTVARTNILSTQFLLDRYSNKIQRFILASTSEALAGSIDYFGVPLPVNESVPLCIADVSDPRSSYGGSKLTNELQVLTAHAEHSLPFTVVRYFNVYGPGQRNQFIPDFIARAQKGDLSLSGGGSIRGFLYVDDAMEITERIMTDSSCLNQTINLGSPVRYTIRQVAQTILDELGIQEPLIETPGPERYRSVDISKLATLIGFNPKISLEQGIRRVINS